jgi:PAS domain S-box-containing protein
MPFGDRRRVRVHGAGENLAVILDHVGDGVTAQDASGQLIYANAAAASALGFASAEELVATPTAEIVSRFALFDENGDPFPLDRLPGRRALAGEPEPAVTVRFRVGESGEDRWSVIRSSPVVDASGRVLFAVNVWQDATAQKRGEAAQRFLAEAGEALATSLDIEETLASIARLAVPRLADWCAVHIVREDGTVSQLAVEHVDPERVAWARRLQEQYPANEDSAQGIANVVRTGIPELYSEVTDAMLEAAARDEEHLAILRRVGLTSILVVPMMVRGRGLGAITFAAAESQRRYDDMDLELAQELARRAALAVENARLYNAERDARIVSEESRARFRALFEGVPDAILVVDAEARFLEANAAACHLLGYTLDDLLARRLGELSPDPETAQAAILHVAETGEGRVETELQRKDGSPLAVEIWSRRLDLATGPIVISVVRDISERLASDEVREEVISAISHDLRNPLGSIKLHAQSLRRMLARGTMPDAARLDDGLTAIDAMSTRIASLLEDIVAVARARGAEGLPYAPEPTDLVALARQCVDEAAATASRHLEIESATAAIVGMWDPRGIERVVFNLLNNAIKYSPAGGDIRLDIAQTDVGGRPWVRLTVRDEGIGIPTADLARIFERYRRGRNVGQISGTGLGLTGARQIIEQHGGAIDIESKEGRGTAVTVRLPLESPLDRAAAESDARAATNGG